MGGDMLVLVSLVVSLIASSSAAVPKWCAVAGKEKTKCDAWVSALGGGKLDCVSATSHNDCMQKIASGQADLAAFDGGDIYTAGKKHEMKVIMAEKLVGSPADFTSYYAVAVVKKGTSWTISNLQGKASSCHTGVMKTSGWIVPVGYFLSSKKMPWKDCNVYGSVAAYFNGSCAPGANDASYNPKMVGATKLCQKCIGDATGKNKCKRNSNERYYSYTGALKCLEDGAGDVAFIKQSTVLQNAKKDSYELLCKDNTRKAPAAYSTCNLARAPSHGVMTSKAKSAADINTLVTFLVQSDAAFGNSSSGFKLYDGILFSKSTEKLLKVDSAKQAYDSYLDAAYIKDLEAIQKCPTSGAAVSSVISSSVLAVALTLAFYLF